MVGEHAVNVNFALGGFDWELFLQTAIAADRDCLRFVAFDFDADGFFPASWAREEFG